MEEGDKEAWLNDPEVPEALKSALHSGLQIEQIRLDGSGRFWHQGQLFDNPKVIKLFARSLQHTKEGHWLLKIGRFSYPITVDDVGVFVERIAWVESVALMKLSDQRELAFVPEVFYLNEEGALYLELPEGGGLAKLLRLAQQSLAPYLLDIGDGTFALDFEGQRIAVLPRP